MSEGEISVDALRVRAGLDSATRDACESAWFEWTRIIDSSAGEKRFVEDTVPDSGANSNA